MTQLCQSCTLSRLSFRDRLYKEPQQTNSIMIHLQLCPVLPPSIRLFRELLLAFPFFLQSPPFLPSDSEESARIPKKWAAFHMCTSLLEQLCCLCSLCDMEKQGPACRTHTHCHHCLLCAIHSFYLVLISGERNIKKCFCI